MTYMTYMTNGRILYGNIQRIVQVCKRGYLMVKYESYPDPWIVPNKRHGMPWVSCQVFGTHDRAGTLGWSVSVQTICGFPCLGMESNWQHQPWINQGRNEIRQTLLHLSNHSQSLTFLWIAVDGNPKFCCNNSQIRSQRHRFRLGFGFFGLGLAFSLSLAKKCWKSLALNGKTW